LTYNSTAKTFTLAAQTDTKNVGVYMVTLESKVTLGAVGNLTTYSFTITITSDCDTTSIIAPTLTAMTVNVSQSATKDVTFADTSGNLHPTVVEWCGARSYTITSTPAATFFSVTGTTFTASPTLAANVGVYSVTL
jgi:hypothetical protein